MTTSEWLQRAATWWTFFRISVEERLVYRVDYAFGTLLRFLPIITQIFLWWTIFESASATSQSSANRAARHRRRNPASGEYRQR